MLTIKYVAVAFLFLFITSSPLLAQELATQGASTVAGTDRPSFEVQVNLIVASSEPGTRATLPQAFEPIVKQLKQSLPYTNYTVAATYTNRVRVSTNNTSVESKGVLASELIFGPSLSGIAIYYEYTMGPLKLINDGPNPSIETNSFRFGLQIPIYTGTARSDGSTPQILEYRSTGMTTQMLGLREGIPTLIGTLTTNKPNQQLVIVITIRRTL